MKIWLNIGFAWISMLLVLLLTIIIGLRVISKNSNKKSGVIVSVNRFLRKHHKLLGISLVATGLIHGFFSSDSLFSFNIGTLAWLLSILLGVNFMIRKKLGRFKGWMYYHRLLTVLFIGSIFWHIVDVGGIQVHHLLFQDPLIATSPPVIQPSILSESGVASVGTTEAGAPGELILADGTYAGEATGYRSGLQVSVTIEDEKIKGIEVTDHNEVNARYYAEPIESIPLAIIEAQSTEVDTISGATFTSIGVINAVNDALSSAVVSGELPVAQELPVNTGRHKRSNP